MNKKVLLLSVGIPVLTAVFGNLFIPPEGLIWYETLNHPWYKLPLWCSVIVALLIYVGYGVVLYRAGSQGLKTVVVQQGELLTIQFSRGQLVAVLAR